METYVQDLPYGVMRDFLVFSSFFGMEKSCFAFFLLCVI